MVYGHNAHRKGLAAIDKPHEDEGRRRRTRTRGMTNSEARTRGLLRHSDFVIGHSDCSAIFKRRPSFPSNRSFNASACPSGVILFQDFRNALIIFSSEVFAASSANWYCRKTRQS